MMEERTQHNRFKGLPWYPRESIYILVGGAGGIGSWVTFLLTRAGFRVMVYDFDTLEEDNLSGQLYPKKCISQSKVSALNSVCREFSNEEILAMNEKIDKNSPTHIYCIAAFDNMEARKIMFEKWYEEYGRDNKNSIFIDGRLEAEHMFIYCVTTEDTNKYKKVLEEETDETIGEVNCTERQTSHVAAMIASHIVGFFTNHITNVITGDKIRIVPFRWEYFVPIDMLVQSEGGTRGVFRPEHEEIGKVIDNLTEDFEGADNTNTTKDFEDYIEDLNKEIEEEEEVYEVEVEDLGPEMEEQERARDKEYKEALEQMVSGGGSLNNEELGTLKEMQKKLESFDAGSERAKREGG